MQVWRLVVVRGGGKRKMRVRREKIKGNFAISTLEMSVFSFSFSLE